MPDPAESRVLAIIRPIVEGQIRGFLKEHPRIIDAVDWYKPRAATAEGRTTTFVNSLAKRIVRDLACPLTRTRLAAALLEARPGARPAAMVSHGDGTTLEVPTEAPPSSDGGNSDCTEAGRSGIDAGAPAPVAGSVVDAPR